MRNGSRFVGVFIVNSRSQTVQEKEEKMDNRCKRFNYADKNSTRCRSRPEPNCLLSDNLSHSRSFFRLTETQNTFFRPPKNRSLTWLWEWTFQSFPSTHQLIYHYEDHNCTCFELCDEMDELIFSLSLWHRQPTRSTTTERCSILVFYARLWMITEVCVRVCVGFGNESGIDASTSWRRRKFSYQWKKVEKISLPANPIISTTHHRFLIEKH